MVNIFIKEPKKEDQQMKELFRMLRTNVEFTGADNRCIVFTSATPGDGKSTISFQLARALAESDKKVIFIDADLRKSLFQQKFLIMEDQPGLSHILARKNELMDAISTTNIPNLCVITTGVIPSNPAELLGKAAFGEMLSDLKRMFDYIIIDSPPIGLVIDAAVIARVCDGTILVVHADKNSWNDERRCIDQMRIANPNILGVVLNKVARGHGPGYYYKHNYESYGPSASEQKKMKKKAMQASQSKQVASERSKLQGAD